MDTNLSRVVEFTTLNKSSISIMKGTGRKK
jgi:hypothetical protein